MTNPDARRLLPLGREPRTNPFSTRFVRPGAIAYQFNEGQSATRLVVQLEQHGWWGQIIGPHGTGKSTLLATLLPELRARRDVVTVELHTDRRRFLELSWESGEKLLVVDGYEQLGWWTRHRIQKRCRQCGWGLLVTAHSDLGLPTLYCTSVTPKLARTLIKQLLSDGDPELFANVDLRVTLERHHGNLREVLFELYDQYEAGVR